MARDDVLTALESLYRARFPALLRVAVAITGDEQSGRDAVHEAFVRAIRHRRGFRRTGPVDAWLWRILVNEARKRRSRDGRTVAVGVAACHERASDNGTAPESDIRAVLASLPERQRTALFLRYYADLDYAAIATALGVAPGTVAATLNAAHAAVRRELTEVTP